MTEKRSVYQQLAAADEDKKVVTIHPAAIKNYLADVELMRKALEDDKSCERRELMEPMRRLIHSVVVHAEPGVKGFAVEIKGRLHELINRPLVGGAEWSRDRYRFSPHDANLRYFLRSSA